MSPGTVRNPGANRNLASSADAVVIASLWALVGVLLTVIAIEPILTGSPAC